MLIHLFRFYVFTGPRYRRPKKEKPKDVPEEKRPRTAFSTEQLARLKVRCLFIEII